MSLRGRSTHPLPFDPLPLWRRVVLICGLKFSLVVGAMSVDIELGIDSGAPTKPVAATGEICKVEVMHGSIRSVTPKRAGTFGVLGK